MSARDHDQRDLAGERSLIVVAAARTPGRRSRLLAPAAGAELRDQLRALLAHVDATESDGAREPPRSPAELLVVWLAHYQRSANTRAAYARELLLFLGWLRAQRIDAFAVRGADVERYLRRLKRAGLAEASRARALAALAA